MSARPTIIIPVHNRRATSLACLRRLRECGDLERCGVIVVNDGSTDGTGEAIRAEFPEVEILHGDGNLWWTGAIALGSAHAFAQGGEIVFWLNDDCLPCAGALDCLTNFLQANPRSVAAPVCVDPPTGARIANAFIGRRALPAPGRGEIAGAEGLSGYCLAVPRAVWEKLDAPDAQRFPHYYGDTAFTLLAHAAGFQVAVVGDAEVELADYRPPLRSPGRYRAASGSWRGEFARTFFHPKSPFRLATQWHLLRLKYGALAGTALALLRFASWSVRFTLRR